MLGDMHSHYLPLTEDQLDDIRDRHLFAEHRAEQESEFAASNAHHDRGLLLEEIDRMRGLLHAARLDLAAQAATSRPGILGAGVARLRRAG